MKMTPSPRDAILFLCLCYPIFLINTGEACAQHLPGKSVGTLEFYLDAASFRSSLGNTYQEFYYQIPLGQLAFTSTEGRLLDTLEISFSLKDESGDSAFQNFWTTPLVASAEQELAGRFIPEQFDLLLQPGKYLATLSILEPRSSRQGIAELAFDAGTFDQQRFASSSIQFASDIRQDSLSGKFAKNGLSILPNPSRTFGSSLPMVMFYCEIYNVPGNPNVADSLEFAYELLSQDGKVVRQLPAKRKPVRGSAEVEVGAISTAGLSDSLYQLHLTLKHSASKQTIEQTAFFRNVPLAPPAEEESVVAQIINEMTPEALSLHIRQARYIITKDEGNLLKQLDETGKRRALIQFWQQRDSDSSTSENEFWQQYMGRIQLANSRYTTKYEEGWLSDRGRILIKYGVPDDIERHPVTIDSKPFEVWRYYRERGLRFIFIDESGFNRYRLIFSNVEDEVTDPSWQNLINYK